jgi:hypothetical protein
VLLSELVTRLRPPSAPVTPATAALIAVIEQIITAITEPIGLVRLAERTPVADPDLGHHSLRTARFEGVPDHTTLAELAQWAEEIFRAPHHGQGATLEHGQLLAIDSLLDELSGRLRPPSAPTTPATEAVIEATDQLSSEYFDLAFNAG